MVRCGAELARDWLTPSTKARELFGIIRPPANALSLHTGPALRLGLTVDFEFPRSGVVLEKLAELADKIVCSNTKHLIRRREIQQSNVQQGARYVARS